MSRRGFILLLMAASAFVPLMLIADGPNIVKQLGVAAATGLFLIMIIRRGSVPAEQIVCAMVIATAGELFLSLVWGLYSYRFAAIPYFVPIGHGVFYAIASESARQDFLLRHERTLKLAVLLLGTLYALISLVAANDVWGLLWWIGAALLLRHSRHPVLMATCIVYTILLEWIGTAIGNWRWNPVVPLLGLSSANPPSGVGILYCLLDLFTVMACSTQWFSRLRDPIRRLHAAEFPGAGWAVPGQGMTGTLAESGVSEG